MPTAMSEALVKAGVISQQQSDKVEGVPEHLKPFADLLAEKKRLVALLQEHKVEPDLLTLSTVIACRAMHGRGEHKEALEYMISHMRSMLEKHGIVA